MGRKIDKLVPLNIRAAALMPAAVLTVHQLRYQLAFGSGADSRLASEGHQYLGAFAPLAAMLLAIAVGLLLATMARVWRQGAQQGGGHRSAAPLSKVWLLAAASLLAIYCGQELLEGLLTTGHPAGLEGVFGHGGLWAVPLSALLGAIVAVCLRVADVAVRWAAGRDAPPRRRRALPAPARRPLDVFLALHEPLAGAAAGRAPPVLLSLTS